MRRLGRVLALGSCLGGLCLGWQPRPAGATTMMALDLPALTERAEMVVAGRVLETRSAWTPEHDAIYTDVTLLVDRALAGPVRAGEQIVVRREGGSVDGVGMKVYGAPSFTRDEEVVVFLERRGAARYVVGMAQGKLALVRDAAGVRRLRRDLSEVALTRATRPGAPPPGAEELRTISTLDELARRIAALRATRKTP
jgi:hypothetical protein